jgi:hypothetical protein
MKVEIEEITVKLNRKDAISIINNLNPNKLSMSTEHDDIGAKTLLKLLQGSFIDSKRGVHF